MEFVGSGRSVALEIDLNEAPLPSPRAAAGGAAEQRCGSCGEMEGEMVVCGECGRRFHVECLGVKQEQRVWKCFDCLIELGGGRRRRRAAASVSRGGFGSGLLDMNASPPRDGDSMEEEYFYNPELAFAAGFPKMHDIRGNTFVGFALSSPLTHSDLRFIASGFPSQNAASNMARIAHLNIGTVNQRANLVYLQALKDYISRMRGVLGEGWRVKFEFSESRCKTYPIYYGPDGTRCDSMPEVAFHLGLLSTFNSFETEDKGSDLAFMQKRSQSFKRTKEAARSLRANSLREHKNMARRASIGRNIVEVDSVANGSYGPQSFLFQDGFPVQFEDFFVLSVGKIDPRPSFHNTSQIWPVGYKSIWHDKLTGSLFVCNVLDGGDSGPIFRLHRYPCTKHSIPNASTVLCPTKSPPSKDNSAPNPTFHDDEDINVHMIFSEPSPPHLDDDGSPCYKKVTSCLASKDDVMGEFSVEGMSVSSAWQKGVETLLHTCRKVHGVKKVLNFCCHHSIDEQSLNASYTFNSLGKFCYLAGPINEIPDVISTPEEFEAACEVLGRWLQRDRFGLDEVFVQELIEQLPEVSSCSEYKSLSARYHGSSLQSVKSGFFTAINKNDLQRATVSSSLRKDHKRPGPPGNKLASNLPPHLIGDVLQAYEICLRFYEVLGQEAPLSRQEMEYELMNPWVDDLKPVKTSLNEIQNNGKGKAREGDLNAGSIMGSDSKSHGEDSEDDVGNVSRGEAASKCTGIKLANFHMALLKVLIEDTLVKVKEIFDPFGGVESKSRKGRKKDVDVAVSEKKAKLGMFPVNEFTWPELARRYILVMLSMNGNLESLEVLTRECGKVFYCLYGDGGTLCGALTGVASMEADAMVLAEASKKIFSSVKSKISDFVIDQKEIDTGDSAKEINMIDSEAPEWIQALEPVRKLPTNVGARIRRCIHESLNKNPPEWAEKILVHSISKEVYKGNASGPTKRAVISVLEKVRVDNPQQKPTEKKEKEKSGVKTLLDVVMKRCRIVLRSIAAADEDRLIFNLLAKSLLKPNDPDDAGLLGYPAMVSRPLDFRTVDLRLAAGVYGTSHESFIEDVREVWQNLRIAFRDKPDYIDLVKTLSQKFEEMYEEEVLNVVNRIAESSNSFDSSNDESKKELNEMLVDISESSLPAAPWEDGVCKVCGMDKDDDSVLLCDKCDSEYHTYCLDPPLARIPEGNWYCPSCLSSQIVPQDERCGTRALCRWRGKKKFQKEFTRKLLETLAPLANTMELIEYWELGIEERVFLFKFLCDEALSSGVIRNHLGPDSADLEKKLRKLYKELKNQNKQRDLLDSTLDDKNNECEDEFLSFPKSVACSSQSQNQNEETEENRPKASQDLETHEAVDVKNKLLSLHAKIADLESKISKLVVRREYLGRDLDGRLYWVFSSPERVVVSGPQSRGKSLEFESSQMHTFDHSSWTCYKSDSEIDELILWLRDDDAKEKELKETIVHWQRNKLYDPKDPQNDCQSNVKSNSSSSIYDTKARAALEKKFGSFSPGSTQYSKKQIRKGKMVHKGKIYRCDCLELAGSARHHCSSCHSTFSTNEELEGHEDGKCEKRQAGNSHGRCLDGIKKGKRESDGESHGRMAKQLTLTDRQDRPECPFNFEEIRAKFCTRSSLKEEVKDIGLIGLNGTPLLIHEVPQNSNAALFLGSGTKNGGNSRDRSTFWKSPDKQGTSETPSKMDRTRPKGVSGKSSLKNRSQVRVCQSSLRPLTGKVCEVLRCLKINLLDMETALPEEALRPSRGSFERIRAWRGFVKLAQSIYEMVQATIILEDMIKTEYLRKEWWYWSSPSTAAKISTIAALALRIYALDAAIYYETLPPPAHVEPTEPITPVGPKSEKRISGKSNAKSDKDSSEKSNSKNNVKSNSPSDLKLSEGSSRPKTRSKKRMRDSED